MKNKRIVITGSTSGIGYITSYELAKSGANLVLVARNKTKLDAQKTELQQLNSTIEIDTIVADLSIQSEVFKAGAQIKAKFPVIDVLINNAGVINQQFQLTADGVESTFALNHIAYFILTDLLLDNLKAAPKARIINTASEASRAGKAELDKVNSSEWFTPIKAYGTSKMANIIFTIDLAKRLNGTNISVNCMHPGAVRTGFAMEMNGFMANLFKFFRPVMRSPEKGAETVIWLAKAAEVENISGKYFKDKKQIKAIATVYNPLIAKQLTDISLDLINREYKNKLTLFKN